ncbi:MAG: RecX family transcriptional regulator [Chloroflexi bacterium]|nr:RecX family transcriptional regulator [Chloroflexota bacterium]MCL5075034.1 RecX family transcriptional regulator [Chloroflexota bacterium]
MSGIITAIRPQESRDRVNIYLDDRFAFSLTALVAEAAQIGCGQFLSNEEIAHLLSKDSFQRGLDSALHFLSYRPRSESEVRHNLLRKGLEAETIGRIIDRLKEMGLIDDSAFARFWVENRETFNPRSTRALRMELRQKGIAREIVEETLADAHGEESLAYAAAQKRLRKLKTMDDKVAWQKIGHHLSRRGFSYDVISLVINRLQRESVSSDRGSPA